jgi:hypothetical protein
MRDVRNQGLQEKSNHSELKINSDSFDVLMNMILTSSGFLFAHITVPYALRSSLALIAIFMPPSPKQFRRSFDVCRF